MASKMVLTCDVCGSSGVFGLNVLASDRQADNSTMTVDLCNGCAQKLLQNLTYLWLLDAAHVANSKTVLAFVQAKGKYVRPYSTEDIKEK